DHEGVAEPSELEDLDRALAARAPAVLDVEPEHGAELLDAEGLDVAAHALEPRDEHARVRWHVEAGAAGDHRRVLPGERGVEAAAGRERALEQLLLPVATDVRAVAREQVEHGALDRSVADDRVLRE